MTNCKLLLALAATTMFCMPAAGQKDDLVQPEKDSRSILVAALGVSTRTPSKQETIDLGLKMEVRVRGQIVTKLVKDGAAAKAGIKVGDVLIQLDQNEIFSKDDIADFLSVARSGQKVDVLLQGREKPIQLSLGSERVRLPLVARLKWQYASLGQLAEAFTEARKSDKVVLLGISGAET